MGQVGSERAERKEMLKYLRTELYYVDVCLQRGSFDYRSPFFEGCPTPTSMPTH